MRIYKITVPFLIAVGLSACGGGGGGGSSGSTPPPSGTAEGLWQGSTNTNRAIAGVVLDDGTYWFIYSSAGNSVVIAGVVQGNGASNNGGFSSSNGKDFNLEGLGVNNFTLAGTYTQKSGLVGTLTYSPSSTTTFTNSYDTDYDLTPSLAAIAGNYSGSAATSGGTESATVIITSSGAITGRGASGCNYTGSASPRTKGNVYNISVTFSGGVCANGTSTVTGIAYFDAPTKQLTSAALNSARSDGFIYVGTKL